MPWKRFTVVGNEANGNSFILRGHLERCADLAATPQCAYQCSSVRIPPLP